MTGRLAVLVRGVVVLATACVGLAAWAAVHGPMPDLRASGLTVALFCAGAVVRVRTRVGAQQLDFGWGQAALILALVLVPPAWVVLLTPVGAGLALLWRQAAAKAAYHVAVATIASAAGAAVAALAARVGPPTASGMVALVAAGVVGGLVVLVGTAVGAAVAQGIPVSVAWRAGEDLPWLTTVGNVTAAAAVVVLADHDRRLAAVLPVLGLCLHQGYAGWLRGREERRLARRQARAAEAFADEPDQAAVASLAAAEIADLLAADIVEVELHGHDGLPATLYRHVWRGQPWSGAPEQAPEIGGRLVAQIPIAGGPHPLGLIRVRLAGDPTVRLSTRDETAIRTFALAVQAALARTRADERLRRLVEHQAYQATHDQATGLPTHDALIDHVESCLARLHARGSETPVAACVVDIGGFREITSTLGRPAAQRLLRHAADQLSARAGSGDYPAHLGDDSFAVFMWQTGDLDQVRSHVLSLLAAIGQPVAAHPSGAHLSLNPAAGIAYATSANATTAADLLRQATVALDRARGLGLQVSLYEPAHEPDSPPPLVLAAELRTGLDRRQLQVLYQPMVDLTHYWPVAVEASVRWLHPTRGGLRPEEFLPALRHSPADHAGFVRWYLDQALSERSTWECEDLPVAVNLDSRALLDRGLVDHVAHAIGRAGIAPDQLMIELTETAAPSTSDTAEHVLAQLRYLGVRLAVDDFGTGQTSLARLLRLPATDLKISSGLVVEVLKSEQAATVIRAAVEVGRSLGHQVIALGVSTAEQAAALRDLDCPAAQGHHLVPALGPARLHAYLREAPRRPTMTPADVIVLQARRPTSATDHGGGR